MGRDFEVGPCTLIPRPCTETLVERALDWYRARGAGPARVLDLCTGTGCIAVSLALGMRAIRRPDGVGCRPISAVGQGESADTAGSAGREALAYGSVADTQEGSEPRQAETKPLPAAHSGDIHVVATDIVADAVELARRNASRHGARIELRSGDLWHAVQRDERFDLVVSNPPYVSDEEYAALDRNVKEYEPATALRGGRDGLDFVRRVVAGGERHLRPDGLLAVEIGWKHRDAALALVSGSGWRSAAVLKDCDGIDRVLIAERTDVGRAEA